MFLFPTIKLRGAIKLTKQKKQTNGNWELDRTKQDHKTMPKANSKRKTSAEKGDEQRAKDVKAMIVDTVMAAFINMVQVQNPVSEGRTRDHSMSHCQSFFLSILTKYLKTRSFAFPCPQSILSRLNMLVLAAERKYYLSTGLF
jgi:hypothetical protein